MTNLYSIEVMSAHTNEKGEAFKIASGFQSS